MKLTKPAILILIGILLVTTAITYAVLTASVTIHNEGKVTGVGVQIYFDSARQQPCTQLYWDSIDNNTDTPQILYLFNNGTKTESLNLITSNWNVTGTLTWDREGFSLPAQTTISAVLTLKVTTDAEAFKFDITITGIG